MSIDWRDIPSLTALRAFDATARHGGFAAAARSLNVTHAAVAQQVRALEQDFGVSLVLRQGRNVALTPAGKRLASGLGDAFTNIADVITGFRTHEQQRGLRITATPFLVDHILMPNLAQFWSANPQIEISLHPSRAYVDIVQEGFDLGIRAIPVTRDLSWPGLTKRLIAEVELIAIASPGLVETFGDDPQKIPWMEHEGMETKLNMMRDAGLETSQLTMIPIGSPNLLLEAARQGRGATVFNAQIAEPDIAAGRLVRVPLPLRHHARYFAVTPPGPESPIVTEFVDWCRTLFQTDK